MVTDRKSVEPEPEAHGEETAKRKKAQVPKIVVALVLLVVLVPVFVGILAAAGKASEAIGGAVGQPPTSAQSGQSSTSAASPTPTVAHVGATISVKDQAGNPMDVTLVKVVDPATASDNLQPDNGKRFVGVQIKLTNTGTSTISDDPDTDVTAFDSASQSYNFSLYPLDNCPKITSQLKLTPGSSALGCESFELPVGTPLAKFQFTPSSGFSSFTGEWLVP